MKKIPKAFLIFILAYLTTISMAGVTGYGITGIEIILPCLFALSCIVYAKAANINKTKRDIWCSVPVGVIFSASVVVGAHYDIWDEAITGLGIKDLIYFIMLSLFYISAVLILFSYIDKIAVKKSECNTDSKERVSARQSTRKALNTRHISRRKKYWVLVAFFLIAWMPYYLTMLPGNLGKDTFESIDMCLGNIPWTNHHPIFFTALINIVIKLTAFAGSVTFSMAVFTLLHMFAVACTLSYMILWLKKYICGKCTICDYKGGSVPEGTTRCTYNFQMVHRICGITLLFFAFHPIVAMYSIYISKDVLFSCALVLFTLKLIDLKGDFSDTKDCLILGLWALLTMLLRNNGLLIMCIMAIIMLIAYKKAWKNILIATVAPILLFLIIRTSAYKALNIAPESFAESASIPLQQIGYVIAESQGVDFAGADFDSVGDEKTGDCNGSKQAASESNLLINGLSSEDITFLQELMPFERVAEVYNLGYTDDYKFDEQFDDDLLNANKGKFLGIWAKALPYNFCSYVKAYLAQTSGYWHYGETNTVCTQGVWEDNTVGVERIDVFEKVLGLSLYGIIEKLMLVARKAPLLCILSSMAMQFYALLLLICVRARKPKNGEEVISLLPLLLLWVSIMIASPAFCLFRYTYPIFLMWPVMITAIIKGGIRE